MRHLILLVTIFLGSCALKIEEATADVATVEKREIKWPHWQPSTFRNEISNLDQRFLPNFIKLPSGEVATYGSRSDGTEQIAIISKRENNTRDGIFQLRQCILPTSFFAGNSPLLPNTNELLSHDRKWFYPAYDFRSTFFDLYPAHSENAKGLILYHTSIMFLSVAEKRVVMGLCKRGWNVIVALPPDSLYRAKVPAMNSSKGNIRKAAQLIAEGMDKHYLEQAHTTKVALQFLARTRPEWLNGKRVLMGTSAGTFAMPVEAIMNPGWDALVFISGGTNLLSLYESGSGGFFSKSLKWIDKSRRNPPTEVTRIFSDDEYHKIYQLASTMTKFHAGELAPLVRDCRTLMMAGRLDQITPKGQALELYHSLGSPERWSAPLGHHLMAVQVALEVDRIDRWIMGPKAAKENS